MAPEQAVDSGRIDRRADVYGLGCTLYFLLTGNTPYTSPSAMGMMLKHRDAPIPYLNKSRADVPPELDAIVRKMIAKDPLDRHQTMAEVVQDLERLQNSGVLTDSAAALFSPPRTPEHIPHDTQAFSEGLPADNDSGQFVLKQTSSPSEVIYGLSVVLVEPSRVQAAIIRRNLEELGIRTIHTSQLGRVAIEKAKQFPINLVISSMNLADMSGPQLAREILDDRACDAINIILTTSNPDHLESAGIPENQRLGVLPKPFDVQQLALAISTLFN
jgi:serine/threonine protein kinase